MKKTEHGASRPPTATAAVPHTVEQRMEQRVPETAEKDPPVEVDRRGKPLPARQRVGGIITPQ